MAQSIREPLLHVGAGIRRKVVVVVVVVVVVIVATWGPAVTRADALARRVAVDLVACWIPVHLRPSALPRVGSAAAIIIIIPARSVGVADAQVVEDTPACRSTGRRCRDRCEIAPSRRRTGIVAALPGVGKEVIAAAVAVVVEAILVAEAVYPSPLLRGARSRHARVGEHRDVARCDQVDVAVLHVLHALAVVLAVALPVRSPVDGHEAGAIRILAHRPAGRGIGRIANILVEVGGTPAVAGSPVACI